MNILAIITLLGGLAFFLYGMNVLSGGLERMAGSRLEQGLRRMTANKYKGLLLGAGITAAIQSSSATTVMLVGLVNSGLLTLQQTVGVVMGANVGTTLTAWLLSLVGLETSNLFLQLLKPENFSLLLALFGVLMMMGAKKAQRRDAGSILVGFAVLMYGMKLMSNAVAPLTASPAFRSMLVAFHNPLLGVLLGAVFTAIIQSSSASVGILQALAGTGSITYAMAVPIILGQNIGTCCTTLISSIGVSRSAKKVAVLHVSFNVLGAGLFLAVYYGLNALLHFPFAQAPIFEVGIAIVHTLFNLTATAALLPFSRWLVALANRLVPDTREEAKVPKPLVDHRLLATPAVAIGECVTITGRMAQLAQKTLLLAMAQLENPRDKDRERILAGEAKLDHYEDQLTSYLVELSRKKITEDDARQVSAMLLAISDLERLGDLGVSLMLSVQALKEKELTLPDSQAKDMAVLSAAMAQLLKSAIGRRCLPDESLALEAVIRQRISDIRQRHIVQLQAGQCQPEIGFVLSDWLSYYAQAAAHCANLALPGPASARRFDRHRYRNDMQRSSSAFSSAYRQYLTQYALPGETPASP